MNDQVGLLSKITTIIANHNSNIKNLETETISQKAKKLKIVIEIEDLKQLNEIYQDLIQQKFIYSIVRKRLTDQ